MSNLTIENLFQKTLAGVKAAIETVSEEFVIKVWSKHLYERVARGVTFCWPPKAFFNIRQHQFVGTFPKKGRFISKGKNYMLYHCDTFLDEFQNKSPKEIISLSKKAAWD